MRGLEQARKHKLEADRQVAGRKLCVKAYKQVKKHMPCVFSVESKRENTTWKLIDRLREKASSVEMTKKVVKKY